MNKVIVLVGLMGAGKTTVGKRLAKSLGVKFKDSDEEICKAAGCSIADIFAIHGEEIFRDLEQRVISRLLGEGESYVLATGGGAWMSEAVRGMIKKQAVSVWLKADLDVLLERVSKRNHRPLLETGDKRDILSKLMDERYPIYGTADIAVDSDNGAHERVVKRIIEELQEAGHAVVS